MVDKKEPASEPTTIVLRWKGDASVFVNGVPNRDVTEADALSKDAIKEAIASKTHEKVN
jgi:hypothetical protein